MSPLYKNIIFLLTSGMFIYFRDNIRDIPQPQKNNTMKENRKNLTISFVNEGMSIKEAKTKVASLSDQEVCDLLGVQYETETDTDTETESLAIRLPKRKEVIGKLISLRNVVLGEKEVAIATVAPILGEQLSIFLTPAQVAGFRMSVGNFVKITYEVRKKDVTQYVTSAKEVKTHTVDSLGFVSSDEYSDVNAKIKAVMSVSVEERASLIEALKAFA